MRFGVEKIVPMMCVAVATLVVILFAIIPHHHHGGVVCMVTEHCVQDATLNQHYGHNECDSANHNSSCLTETEYVASSNSDDDVKCKVSSCDSHDHSHINHILPLLCILVDAMTGDVDLPSKEHEYRECVPIYKSVYVGLHHSLRAPPYSFC